MLWIAYLAQGSRAQVCIINAHVTKNDNVVGAVEMLMWFYRLLYIYGIVSDYNRLSAESSAEFVHVLPLSVEGADADQQLGSECERIGSTAIQNCSSTNYPLAPPPKTLGSLRENSTTTAAKFTLGASGTQERKAEIQKDLEVMAHLASSGFTPQSAAPSVPVGTDTSSGKTTATACQSSSKVARTGEHVPGSALPIVMIEHNENDRNLYDVFCIASDNGSVAASELECARVESVHSSAMAQSIHSSIPVQSVHSSVAAQSIHSSVPVQSVRSSVQVQSVHSSVPVQSIHSSVRVQSVHSSPKSTAGRSSSSEEVEIAQARADLAAALADSARAKLEVLELMQRSRNSTPTKSDAMSVSSNRPPIVIDLSPVERPGARTEGPELSLGLGAVAHPDAQFDDFIGTATNLNDFHVPWYEQATLPFEHPPSKDSQLLREDNIALLQEMLKTSPAPIKPRFNQRIFSPGIEDPKRGFVSPAASFHSAEDGVDLLGINPNVEATPLIANIFDAMPESKLGPSVKASTPITFALDETRPVSPKLPDPVANNKEAVEWFERARLADEEQAARRCA